MDTFLCGIMTWVCCLEMIPSFDKLLGCNRLDLEFVCCPVFYSKFYLAVNTQAQLHLWEFKKLRIFYVQCQNKVATCSLSTECFRSFVCIIYFNVVCTNIFI